MAGDAEFTYMRGMRITTCLLQKGRGSLGGAVWFLIARFSARSTSQVDDVAHLSDDASLNTVVVLVLFPFGMLLPEWRARTRYYLQFFYNSFVADSASLNHHVADCPDIRRAHRGAPALEHESWGLGEGADGE